MVNGVGATFLGLTFACCRCHDQTYCGDYPGHSPVSSRNSFVSIAPGFVVEKLENVPEVAIEQRSAGVAHQVRLSIRRIWLYSSRVEGAG